MDDVKVSIIIVNFNCGELLSECVHSALTSSVLIEVFVFDNGSTDGSIHFLKDTIQDERLHIISNDKNLGFAKANNLALSRTKGDFILFLNPDCVIGPDTIESMLDELKGRPKIGMAGCLILNPDGTGQAGCRRRIPTPARSLVRILHLDKPFPLLREKGIVLHQQPLPNQPDTVEAISGAFMLVRRVALEDVGPMDEGYFLHCEDLDWCMRFRHKGWKISFVSTVDVVHYRGACSHARPIRVEWHKHKGMVRFYRKFFRHQYPILLMWLVICAVWFRFFAIASLMNIRKLTTLH